MVSAPIVITALGIIFIMQLVTILYVRTIKQAISKNRHDDHHESRPPHNVMRDRKDNRDRHERHDRKPEQRPPSGTPQTPNPLANSADKSLREINLRLRNAERDQELARRNIEGKPDLLKNQNRNDPRRRDRNFDRNRDNRDRSGNREFRGNRPNQGNRDNRGWQANSELSRQEQAPIPTPTPHPADIAPVAPVIVPPPVREQKIPETQPTPPVFTAPQTQVSIAPVEQESLEHGRKITVKRRNLNAEETNGGSAQKENSAETQLFEGNAKQENSEDQSPNTDSQPNADISFGRR